MINKIKIKTTLFAINPVKKSVKSVVSNFLDPVRLIKKMHHFSIEAKLALIQARCFTGDFIYCDFHNHDRGHLPLFKIMVLPLRPTAFLPEHQQILHIRGKSQ